MSAINVLCPSQTHSNRLWAVSHICTTTTNNNTLTQHNTSRINAEWHGLDTTAYIYFNWLDLPYSLDTVVYIQYNKYCIRYRGKSKWVHIKPSHNKPRRAIFSCNTLQAQCDQYNLIMRSKCGAIISQHTEWKWSTLNELCTTVHSEQVLGTLVKSLVECIQVVELYMFRYVIVMYYEQCAHCAWYLFSKHSDFLGNLSDNLIE